MKPLNEPSFEGRALTQEEKLRLLKVACQKPEWQTAYWAATMGLNTTTCGGEVRGLRSSDVNLIDRTITVLKGKTKARERVIHSYGKHMTHCSKSRSGQRRLAPSSLPTTSLQQFTLAGDFKAIGRWKCVPLVLIPPDLLVVGAQPGELSQESWPPRFAVSRSERPRGY